MEKSRDAFRTISEVAEWLDVPTHVLRFWESRFSQIKPVKRAGGRRYYRPSDMRVIGGVKTLLHDQGMTIRGVQKLFREKGIKHVSSHAPELYGEEAAEPAVEAAVVEADAPKASPSPTARATRDAAPDPIIDDVESGDTQGERAIEDAELAEESETAEEPVVEFSHRKSTSDAPKVPVIETPAHVAKVDPNDDDPDHAASASVAARLRIAAREDLAQHSDILAVAVEKLKALRAHAD